MDALLAGLNPAQRGAVTSPATVLQVLAPPGSGKTKTLTSRVAYLLSSNGIAPWNIIVCTFTIKAAREMKERIRGIVGEKVANKLILGTFHSVARRFLVSYGYHIGIQKNFGIADSSDSLSIIKRIIKRGGYGIDAGVARSRISGLKAKSTSCEDYISTAKKADQQDFARIYSEYEETLRTSNLLDYDDLLLRCVDLLRTHQKCVSNIEAVLIDEFQDTNHVQFELMSLLAQYKKNITIVGDPDQSIYGFRSAEIKNLSRMQTLYPETVVALLEENYRSSGAILISALEVIEQDVSRPQKRLLSTHCPGERPVFRKLPSSAVEAQWIVTEIQRSMALTGNLFDHSDYAILLRSAALSRQIESALGKAGIPYRMVGGHRFFDRVEVKILLDYLRVVNQPEHNDALVRVINVPPRRIGEETVKRLLDEAEQKKITLWRLVLDAAQGRKRPKAKLTKMAETGLEGFVNLVLTARKKFLTNDTSDQTLVDLLEHVVTKLSFSDYLKKEYKEEFENRWANVQELKSLAVDAAAAAASGNDDMDEALPVIEGLDQAKLSSVQDALAGFLSNVALSTEVEKSDDGEQKAQVTISTIHAAKGLEWPVVFIPSAYEGSIPHSRAEDTDEERRLLYVGMTRAQSLLFISCPLKTSQGDETKMSRFFLTSGMTRFFDSKGPSFGFSVTQDLARILRRPCPLDSVLQNSHDLVERIQDDYWPLDGSDVQRKKTWQGDEDETRCEPSMKRRMLDFNVPFASGMRSIVTQGQEYSSASSRTLNTGFVSAGAHYDLIKQQNSAKTKVTVEIQASHVHSISTHHDEQGEQITKSSKKNSLKKPGSQGNITSFFKRSSTVPLEPPELESRARPSQSQPQGIRNTLSVPKTLTHCASAPLATAPPPSLYASVSSHKPRTEPLHGRPRKSAHNDTNESTRYILLSSSPTKPDDETLHYANQRLNTSNENSNLGVQSLAETTLNTPSVNDFRPASTLNVTTMDQLSKGPQRRTLGMRRSVQGWTSRPHQPVRPRPP